MFVYTPSSPGLSIHETTKIKKMTKKCDQFVGASMVGGEIIKFKFD
jgi:hypothetical protein